MSDLVAHTTDGDFESAVVNPDSATPRDFRAEWCGPCKMIAPAAGTVAEGRRNQLGVIKLNTGEQPLTAPKYSVRSIPSLLLFENGIVAAQHIGAVSNAHLSAFLDRRIARDPA